MTAIDRLDAISASVGGLHREITPGPYSKLSGWVHAIPSDRLAMIRQLVDSTARMEVALRAAIAEAGQAVMPTEGLCDPEDEAYGQGRADTGRRIRAAITRHLDQP